MKGIFGNMFDFNGDGDLDLFEQAAEFSFLNELMDEEEKREALEAEGLDPDDYDLDDFQNGGNSNGRYLFYTYRNTVSLRKGIFRSRNACDVRKRTR